MHTLPTFPPFDPEASYAATGRSALFYVLSHGEGASYMLDDDSLTAAADYVSSAQTARDISAPAIARLTGLQAALRGLQAHRRQLREATRAQFAAMFETFDAAMVADVAPAAAPVAAAVPDVAPVVDVPAAAVAVAVPDVPAPAAAAVVAGPAAVPAGWRAMAARFNGQCVTCGGFIPRGAAIYFLKGTGAMHASCVPAAPPSGGNGGGGGAKVPRKPRPTGGAPAAGLQAPQAAPVAVPVAVAVSAGPAFAAVAPLAPADDWF